MRDSNCVGILGLLGVLFVGLKLGGVITWSWWLVTLPFYVVFAFFFCFAALAGVISLLILIYYNLKSGE